MSERLEKNKAFFEGNFEAQGIPVKCVKSVESPLGDTYFFDLENVATYNERKLKDMVKKLSLYTHREMTYKEAKESHFAICVNDENSNYLSLTHLINQEQGKRFVIGVDEDNKNVYLDFEKIPHLLIAGTTGSGKSVLLHNILVNFLCFYGRKEQIRKAEVLIIDPKGSEFNEYRNVCCATFVDNTAQAIQCLKVLEDEMDRRYKSLDIRQDHDIFVVVDELADLMLTSKFQVEQSIVRLAQKGRACGIHLIVATQRPTIDVVSGLIKANMPYRIGLKTASVRDSVVILDHKGLEELKGSGDSIVKLGLKEYHTQIAYPEQELEAKMLDIMRG